MRAAATCGLLAAAAIGLIGQLGCWFAIPDMVNHFAPIWVGVGMTCALVAWLCRPARREGILIIAATVVLALIGGRMVAPEFLHHEEISAGDHAPGFVLVQFNAMIDNPDAEQAAAWITAQQADVVTIEEARESSEILLRLRRSYPFQTSCLDRDRCSTAILTRQPPLAVLRLARGDPDNRKGLSAVGAVIATRGGPVLVIAAHLNRPWPGIGYDKSIRALAGKLHMLPPMPTVLAGDFNMTPWTFAMARQDALIGLPRLTRALPTWPATIAPGVSFPILPIDHAYARGLHAAGITRGPPLGSDHLPLRLELTFDAPAGTD